MKKSFRKNVINKNPALRGNSLIVNHFKNTGSPIAFAGNGNIPKIILHFPLKKIYSQDKAMAT
ncbi:MAG TPA: hypothetical protein PLJ49_07085 [Smithella sp.]|nr:hypothetical protein [Smithella sp.]HOX98950.1 hypothetical protein [Smithella sp.]HPV52310.1 hypothetical protein [Smithella sp.]